MALFVGRWLDKMAFFQDPRDFRTRFSWFIKGKLAGMPWPDGDAVQFLADQGIKALVNLTTEPASYQEEAERLGIRCVTMGMPDFCPPTVDQVGILQLENLIWLN